MVQFLKLIIIVYLVAATWYGGLTLVGPWYEAVTGIANWPTCYPPSVRCNCITVHDVEAFTCKGSTATVGRTYGKRRALCLA